jgi:hypothetical protein
MNYNQFKIAFWHPFGSHAGETPEKIITRKSGEIETEGWTLWSFKPRLMLEEWRQQIREAGDPPVLVFCSDSSKAKDPKPSDNPPRFTQYTVIGENNWRVIPKTIKVPHPINNQKEGTAFSAFVVQRIFRPIEGFSLPAVEWFSQDHQWEPRAMFPRNEFMIRIGGTVPTRPVYAILELKAPEYLARVRL